MIIFFISISGWDYFYDLELAIGIASFKYHRSDRNYSLISVTLLYRTIGVTFISREKLSRKKLFSNRKRLPPNNYKFHSIDILEARELNPKVKIFLNIPFLFAVPRRNILKLACVSWKPISRNFHALSYGFIERLRSCLPCHLSTTALFGFRFKGMSTGVDVSYSPIRLFPF